MLEVIEAPDDVIAVALSGQLNAHDMRQYQTLFADRLESQASFGLCLDVTELSDITAPGAVAGAKADIRALKHVRRFRRLAVVSDQAWPGVLVGFLASLLPTLDARVFASDERAQALTWASGNPGGRAAAGSARSATAPEGPALRLVPTSKEHVIAFEIDGAVDAASLSRIVDEIESRLASHVRIRLLADVRRFAGVAPDVVGVVHRLVAMKLQAFGKLDRYAMIGAPEWLARLAGVTASVLPGLEIRSFDSADDAQAWDWVDARRA